MEKKTQSQAKRRWRVEFDSVASQEFFVRFTVYTGIIDARLQRGLVARQTKRVNAGSIERVGGWEEHVTGQRGSPRTRSIVETIASHRSIGLLVESMIHHARWYLLSSVIGRVLLAGRLNFRTNGYRNEHIGTHRARRWIWYDKPMCGMAAPRTYTSIRLSTSRVFVPPCADYNFFSISCVLFPVLPSVSMLPLLVNLCYNAGWITGSLKVLWRGLTFRRVVVKMVLI